MKMKLFAGVGLVCSIFMSSINMDAQSLPKRSDIADKYKWNLNDIYSNEDLWEKDYAKVLETSKKFPQFKGTLSKSAKDFYKVVDAYYSNEKIAVRLFFYSSMIRDLDLNDGKYQGLFDRTQKLFSEVNANASFFLPELMAIPDETIKKFIAEESKLKQYEHRINEMRRMKKYTLSADQEKMLAQLSPVFDIPESTYGILNDAELPFPTVKGSKGEDVKISHGRYRAALFSEDREYRKTIYKGTYEPYNALKGTFASLYNGRVKQRLATAEIRGYKSAREGYLYADNIPVEVYDNLIKTTRDNIKILHRWANLKKRALKLDELHPYDTYTSLVPGFNKEYTFDEAKAICLEALKPLGEEYQEALKKCFDNRWIDVYETDGKRSGAYSNGCGCGVHPYILLNWNNTMDDLFTLAHELGHNMHSFFTEKTQPYHYANYSTFVAEVASTTNEALLLDYLIKNAKNPAEKLSLIEKFLLNAQQTFFRQTRFADFEMQTHDKAQKGEILNADQLTKLFGDMYQFYWGPDMVTDYEEGLSWARIPHLYKYNFYVFQYSTGFAAAQALSQQIIEEGKPAIKRYLGFLESGSSVYPIDVLKKAGVDMSRPEPINKTLDKMNKYMDELELLLGLKK